MQASNEWHQRQHEHHHRCHHPHDDFAPAAPSRRSSISGLISATDALIGIRWALASSAEAAGP